jgi:hypothetical protein
MATLVSVKLTVGIPSAAVHYTVLGYGGTFNGGIKCSPNPTIDLDKSGASSLTLPTPSWGITYAYNEPDSTPVPGKPDWFRALKTGAVAIESKQLVRTEDNLNAVFTSMSGASHAVKFMVIGANPLLSLAPAIDAEVTVGLRKNGTIIEYCVSGAHDGFPNYALEVGGKVVYSWDCVAKGESPNALKPPMDQTATVGWTSL